MNQFVLTQASSLQATCIPVPVDLSQGLVKLRAEVGKYLSLKDINLAADEAISLWRKGDDLQILVNGELQAVVEYFYNIAGEGGLAIQGGPFIQQGAAGGSDGLLWTVDGQSDLLTNGDIQTVAEDLYNIASDVGQTIQNGSCNHVVGKQASGTNGSPTSSGSEGLASSSGTSGATAGASAGVTAGATTGAVLGAGGILGAVAFTGVVYELRADEDDSDDNSYPTVYAYAGPFTSEAKVTIYGVDGSQLGTGSINPETGSVDFNVGAYRGLVIIEVVDANDDESDYTSEATGEDTDLDTNLRAMGEITSAGPILFSVTPLTELAAREANLPEDLSELSDNPLTSEQVAINEQIAALFGLEDLLGEVITVLDEDYDADDGINAAELYGDILAILSGVEENLGSLNQMIDRLLDEITITDGVASLSAAGAQLLQQGQSTYESLGSGPQLTGQTWIENIPYFQSVVTLDELNEDQSLTLKIQSVSTGDEVVITLGDQSFNTTITEAMLNSDGSASIDFPAEQLSLLNDGTQTLSISVDGEARQTTQLNLDLTRPSVISVSLTDSQLTIDENGSVESTKVTFTFSEAVIGFSIDDISLEQGSLTGLASQDGGLTWVGIYTPETNVEDAALLIRVSGDYTDLNGNAPDGSSDFNGGSAIDTLVPEAPLLSLQNDSGTVNSDLISNDDSLAVTGVEDGASLQYSTDGGTTWSSRFTATEGDNSVLVRQIDAAGNESDASSLTFTLDTQAAAPAISLGNDTGGSAADLISNDGSLVVTGAEDGTVLEYSIDGGTTWSTDFTAVEGSNTLWVRQTDLAGNTSAISDSLAFTLDTQAAAPTISLQNDTGGSVIDRITNDGALSLSGTEENAIVEYSIDGGDSWSTEFEAIEGVNSVQVRQTDVAGNISAVSNTLTFTLDTTVPTAPTLTLTTDSGSSTSDKITNDSALSRNGDEAGATVQYSTNNGTTWSSSFTAVEGSNTVMVRQTDVAGNTSASRAITFTLDTEQPETPTVALFNDTGDSASDLLTNDGALDLNGDEEGATVQYSTDGTNWTSSFSAIEGTNTVWVRQIDAAGNVSDASSLTFTLDTTVPTTPALTLTTDSGSSMSDKLTNDGALSQSGEQAGATLQYSTDGTNWTSSFSAVEGSNTVWVRQIDAAGNVSDASSLTFTLDTQAAAPTASLQNDTGDSASDLLTNDGALDPNGDEEGATVQYSIDGTNWTSSFSAVEGTNTVWVRQIDAAGNVSDASSLTFTLDTQAAAPTISLENDTGNLAVDLLTNVGTLSPSGYEDGSTLQYSIDGTNWTSSFSAVEGTNTVWVRQIDAAGNVSDASSLTFTLDTQAAAPTISLQNDTGSSTGDLRTNDGTLSPSGYEYGATLQYSTDETNWSGSFTAVEGTNTVWVRQIDAAGSVSDASDALTFTLDTTAPEPDAEPLASPVLASTTQLEALNNTSGDDLSPQITAVGSDGAYVVTWYCFDNASDLRIFVQAFNPDGSQNGSTVQLEALGVTRVTTGYAPQITAVGSEGAYVVTWYGDDSGGDSSIFVQAFYADGTTNGDIERLEAIGYADGSDSDPQITAVGSEGAYVVTWEGRESGGDSSIFVQAFNADGSLNNTTKQLEALGVTDGENSDPQITAVGSEGAYVVAWYGIDSDDDYSIFVQAFYADGSQNNVVVQLDAQNNISTYDYDPQIIAVGDEGAYVVFWEGYNSDFDLSIFVQAFSADGSTNGSIVELVVGDNVVGYYLDPQITAVGSEGAYVVTWYASDSEDLSIFVQAFNPDGSPNGGIVQLEALGVTGGDDENPQITAVGDEGAYVVTWHGYDSSGGDRSVFVQAFNADGSKNGKIVQLEVTDVDGGNDLDPQITAVGSEGAYVVAWRGYDSDGDYSIFVQAFNADGTTRGEIEKLEARGNSSGSDSDLQITAVGDDGSYAVTWLGEDSEGDDSVFVSLFKVTPHTQKQLYKVYLASDADSWEYSLNGTDWVSGSGTQISLPDGTYEVGDIVIRQYDLAGNMTETSNANQLIVDTRAPAAPAVALANDTGSSTTDLMTKDGTLEITGVEDGAILEYSIDGGTTWRGNFEAVEGENSVQVRQTDAAGNVSDASSLTFTLDTQAPEPDEEPLASPVLASTTQLEAIDNTGGYDSSPQITAVGTEGAYVVTWEGYDTGVAGTDKSIFVQAFNADGTANGDIERLEAIGNTTDLDWDMQFTAVGTEGAYAVTWMGIDNVDDGDDYSVFVQAFNADGTTNGPAVRLEAIGNANGSDEDPQITAVGTDGAYVVTWRGVDAEEDGSDFSVFVQAFNADGTTNGPAMRLEAIGNANVGDSDPQITAVGTEGAYVVTWVGYETGAAGSDYSVFVQAFNADGTTNGGIARLEAIGNTSGYDYDPQITAVGTEGAYVVTWLGYDTGAAGTDTSIFVQAFNTDGTTNNDVVRLEALGNTVGDDLNPQITAVGTEGAYVVTWYGEDRDGDNSIFVQAFNADGTKNDDSQQLEALNVDDSSDWAPQITAVGDEGAYVVTWYGEDSEGDRSIFVQAFNADNSLNGGTVQLEALNVASDEDENPQITAVGDEGAYAITWDGTDSEGDYSVFVSLFTLNPDTNDPLYDVYLASDADSWEYSLNGTDWVSGSGTQISLAEGTYDVGSISIRQYDLAGNMTETSNANQLVVDTSAPDVTLTASGGATTVTAGDTTTLDVQSSETGVVYLVNADVTVTSLGDITDAAHDQWNQAYIVTADTNVDMDTTGLAAGDYVAYAADAAGNLSDASYSIQVEVWA